MSPLKVALFTSSKAETSYSTRVLEQLIKINGLELVPDPKDPDSVDVFLCSNHDPSAEQIAYVRKARKLANKGTKGQVVIAGGFEAFGGEYLLNYADYLVVGEGFNFFERLGKCRNTDEVRELADLPYCWTKEKKRVEPSTDVYYDQLPLAKTGEKTYYYLAGRGCTYKCAFCETGFAYPASHTPENMIEKALTYVETHTKGGRITFVTNDSVELHRQSPNTNALSMRVMDYVRQGENYHQASFIHFGIEGWTEEQRKWFAKPIPDEMIKEFILRLIERKQQAELFFITGQPNTLAGMHQFAETVPGYAKPYPRFFIKTTRLEPSAHTPFWSYHLDEIESVTEKERKDWYNYLQGFNKAFRVFAMLANARSAWRCAVRRTSTLEETEWFMANFPPARTSSESFLERLTDAGFGHLIRWPEGRPLPGTQVVTPYRSLRDKLAERRGMPPVTYWHDTVQV